MAPVLNPCLLSQELFDSYTAQWSQLIAGNNTDALNACFMSGADRMNYVYLPHELAVALLSAVNTVAIRTKFALAARTTEGMPPVFSVVLFGIDKYGTPTSAYYLAGVADAPASVIEDPAEAPPVVVPFRLVSAWINNWNKPELRPVSLDFSLFRFLDEPLQGYTYSLHDFLAALAPTKDPNPALWLNFTLHKYHKPQTVASDNTSGLFNTVLALNNTTDTPAPTITLSPGLLYYDIANPCPPACGVYEEG